jgi:hypothetical protein
MIALGLKRQIAKYDALYTLIRQLIARLAAIDRP